MEVSQDRGMLMQIYAPLLLVLQVTQWQTGPATRLIEPNDKTIQLNCMNFELPLSRDDY